MKMWLKILKIAGITALVAVLLLAIAYFALNTQAVQNRLVRYATEELSNRLQTRVGIDSASVTLPSFDVRLHGVVLEDRQQREMLKVGRLDADIDVWRLMKKQVLISEVDVENVTALLIKQPGDTTANYQFVLDALKSGKHDNSQSFEIDINKATLKNCDVNYNDNKFALGTLTCRIDRNRLKGVEAENLATTFTPVGNTAGGTDYKVAVGKLFYIDNERLEVNGVALRSDNHQPRKSKGEFDAGHLDLTADISLGIKHIGSDSLDVVIDRFSAADKTSGFAVGHLKGSAVANRESLIVKISDLAASAAGKNASVKAQGCLHGNFAAGRDTTWALSVNNCSAKFNGNTYTLHKLVCRLSNGSVKELDAERFATTFRRTNRKGVTTHYTAKLGNAKFDGKQLVLRNASLHSDNHRPRKNTGKPNKGFFDAGHLDLKANMQFTINHAGGDTLTATLDKATVRDEVAGIDIRDINCGITANKRGVKFSNVNIRQIDTKLHFNSGVLVFPDKKRHIPLHYSTSTIHGNVILKDISRPFAPPLKNFTIPLTLTTNMSGDNDRITFTNVVVGTLDKKLIIRANGHVRGIRMHDSHAIKAHFDVSPMTTDSKCIERLITQLPVKRFMMSQMYALNKIRYTGSFDVVWRKQTFRGLLATDVGNIDFEFELDHNTKYLTGKLSTDSLAAGRALNMSSIGTVAASADFKIDISKERTAKIRAQNGGKLPIGEASAHITRASYKFIKTHNLVGQVESDGAVANGTIVAPEKYADISCSFTFTNTDELQKMKVKPGIKFHKARKQND